MAKANFEKACIKTAKQFKVFNKCISKLEVND